MFDKDATEFFFENLSKTRKTFPQVHLYNGPPNDAFIALTLERKRSRCDTPFRKTFGHLLNSPDGFHDVVVVGNDGEETKAHKFVLAGSSFVLTLDNLLQIQ